MHPGWGAALGWFKRTSRTVRSFRIQPDTGKQAGFTLFTFYLAGMKTREILFRGKRIVGIGWVEGELMGGEIHIQTSYPDEWWGHEVTPESVGQFTGILDKNGTKIFEGDIVETDGSLSFSNYDSERFSKRQIVVSDCGFVGIRIGNQFDVDHNSSAHIWSNYQLWNIARSLTVIGNVFDNPDLL